ncbi:hypothetical protein PFICI_13903 [Pestalotiopsis fici W106-1]|uniref:AAA+ ATPase domain-containing protein n=1 Tax=Pestalotiopsis fici (strain W106-1 / CGMCC3.15140) TaxID=1229662 RepID=W3WLI5_PESFW|nr:uncharacterized protein PFICI_13903 [Pestalotiopsis fici W106-1]ETS74037.1 hypothetical protein PFICI_13903 [Pestalotiopsis fici W106-1]
MTVDWRAVICNFLGEKNHVEDQVLFRGLEKATENLQELERLRLRAESSLIERPPRFQILHMVNCAKDYRKEVFLDTPTLVKSGPNRAHLRCSEIVDNVEQYLQNNKEVLFVVHRHYECCKDSSRAGSGHLRHQSGHHDIQSLMTKEHITIVSSQLADDLNDLSNTALSGIAHPDFHGDGKTNQYPYIWWFHRRDRIEDAIANMEPGSRGYLDVFQNYLEEHVRPEWDTVDDHLSRSQITLGLLKYLFIPGDIVISRHEGEGPSHLEASVLQDWAEIEMEPLKTQKTQVTLALQVSHWIFVGVFKSLEHKWKETLSLATTGVVEILDLPIYPERFASASTMGALKNRGDMLWKCRHRQYVSSKSESSRAHDSTNYRYMVDMKTYYEMHPPETANSRDSSKELDSELMVIENPDLGDSFFLCLPSSIFGFNMHKHEWVTLQVLDLEEVEWNEDAFSHLVLEHGTKELVQAVVTTRLRAEEHMDVIHGKGNGLFILLHGGPGTGKTLTAESVAEVAKRPLYKVSCGDIGTTVEKVEEYFTTVFELCRIWECVVLLDEADVFLEQRSLQQLERNALVSGKLFLRVLEYYDGILILTTNRIGTFDEAFKSRMHLTLRYEDLKLFQRRQIWTKFISRLSELESSRKMSADQSSTSECDSRSTIDIADITKHLEALAAIHLNGRQIRNAVSTAKQLALFKKEAMGYKHLDRVISEVMKFENYIQKVHGDLTPDEIAEERQIR